MKRGVIMVILCLFPATGRAQNCCAPSVPQQGVLGEMVALPHTLEIGLHYELLRSAVMYYGSEVIADPANTTAQWQRVTVTAGYGISRRYGVSVIIPYVWKKKTREFVSMGMRLDNAADGVGDITFLARFSPITRSFVSFRELSVGLGVKTPTGPIDRRNFGLRLPQELQPGTGSWDFIGSFSFYQGFEPVDFILSGTYTLTSEHDDYKFGNQFSYILASNFHVREYLDLSVSLMGISRGRDRLEGEDLESTGRNQIWIVPGAKFQILPNRLSAQAYFEHPIFQHFNGAQLGSDYNIRISAIYTQPLEKGEGEGG
jgi:hypothetical protein